ncbi:MAG: hypothetical protein ACHP84_17690 [Caulobacterales bacterium]
MAKPRPKKPPVEDEAQSQRFIDLAHELEAEGDIDPHGAEQAFERAAAKVIRPAHRKE